MNDSQRSMFVSLLSVCLSRSDQTPPQGGFGVTPLLATQKARAWSPAPTQSRLAAASMHRKLQHAAIEALSVASTCRPQTSD